MTPFQLAVVGLRLVGIYFVAESGTLFTSGLLVHDYLKAMTQTTGVAESSFSLPLLIPGITQVSMGVLLFIFAAPLARRLVPPVSDEAKKAAYSLEEVQGIAFGAAGILILSGALPNVGHAWQNLYFWYDNLQLASEASGANPIGSLLYALGILAQIIIGLVLLFNPRAFRNIWHWVRTAGTQRRDV